MGNVRYGSWSSNRAYSYTINLGIVYNVFFVSCRIGHSSVNSATTITMFCTYNNQQDISYNCIVPTNSYYSSWTNVYIHINNTLNNSIEVESGTNEVYITDGNWIAW